VVAIVAAIIWLGYRSDAVLSRWAAIAGVLAGVFAVLTFAVTLIPLWPHGKNDNNDDTNSDTEPQKATEATTVTQNINSSGDAYVVGQGRQNVINYPPRDKQKGRRGAR
jgi:hypothetical protein